MTKKAEKDRKKNKPKPRLKKETLKDLQASDRADKVRGGVPCTLGNSQCIAG